jgi:hypothetical protein
MEEPAIDPQLTGDPQPQSQVTLPTRNHDDIDNASDGQGNNEGGEKRRKLNLLKCKQCRDARKKVGYKVTRERATYGLFYIQGSRTLINTMTVFMVGVHQSKCRRRTRLVQPSKKASASSGHRLPGNIYSTTDLLSNEPQLTIYKCFPVDRVWPQKCDRCIQHRPHQLACSEPQMNTRKRGPNQPKDNEKEKYPKLPRRSKTLSISDRQEAQSKEGSDSDDDGSSEEDIIYDRPRRNLRGIKRERLPVSERLSPSGEIKTQRPASAYLTLAEGEFRILQLDPGRKEDKIICSLVTASKNNPIEYEAISYLWGVRQSSKEIQLRDPQGKVHRIFIRSNVYAALRDLRHPKETRSFWVDALCINYSEKDKAEQNRLIAMKLYIFQHAVNNCVWLGEEESSKAGLKFVSRILDLSGIDKLVRDENEIQGWVSFVALLKNTIFSRLWLVQEIAVAQNVTLHCGQPAIQYRDLVEAVAIFTSFRVEISELFRQNNLNPKDLADRKLTMAENFINVSTNALRITNSGKAQRRLSLEALVSELKDLAASNPLDRIYSVLAIAKDGPPFEEDITQHNGPLGIDYDKTVLELYQDFVVQAIHRSQSLDIICRYWASSSEQLPTWVRPLQSTQPIADIDVSERIYPDSLVGLPDHNYYHASRGTVAHVRSSPPSNSITSLFTHGVCIDTISKLGGRAPEGIILYEWLQLGNCVTTEETKATEEFWRTLVADRGPNGSNTPSWYTRAFLYCLHHLTPTGDINTNRLIHECEAQKSPLVVDFLRRVQRVIWNRKFLVSKNNKWIGLAPMAAKVDDLICILDGCSVPVVLRPCLRTGTDRPEVFYQLVGECYVHGMMDGEAKETGSEYVEEDFELR